MERDNIKKELESLKSSLKMMDKGSYDLPESYFSEMQDSIMQKINEEKKENTFSLFPYKRIISLAAALALIVISVWVIKSNINANVTFDDLSEEMVYSYLNENIQEIHENTLLDYLDEGDVQTDLDDLEDEELEEFLEEYLEDGDEYYMEQLL